MKLGLLWPHKCYWLVVLLTGWHGRGSSFPNYTIFCPLNNALENVVEENNNEVDNEISIKLEKYRLKKKRKFHTLLTNHMTAGFYKLDDFKDGQVVEAQNPSSRIRMNIYYTPEK
ncbi:FAS1 domain-containing protein [Caerostris extrusa]|uniref:FAS1 domain-containing protein n=1 Tax=Caerostris extrusa TaxID=172846 RepID=A0AAV4XGX0_CAEEX|nr:FAS1 domain-containing protein [Caerostris extrusa]